MKREEIKEIITQIIDDKFGYDQEIKEETIFKNDLGFDSLDDVELIIECEREFDINIPDEDAEKIVTFKGAVDYIEKRLN